VLRHRSGGHWGFPKGRIEPGEPELAAARRELAEETALTDVQPLPGFRVVSQYDIQRSGQRVSKTVVYYLAEVESDDVRLSSEHTACAWLDGEAANRTLTHDETRRIFRLAEAYLTSAGQTALGGEQVPQGGGDAGDDRRVCTKT